jgi:RNA polymerase sigma-70 factor (ECF subfamily)
MNATPSPRTSNTLSRNPYEAQTDADLLAADPHDGEGAADVLADESDAAVEAAAAEVRALPVTALGEAELIELIERIADRDERALTALYDATLKRVYGLVLRVVSRPALADEVVEETYFQIWRNALRFDAARGCAMAWLLGMARSRAIDAVRREARFQHASLDAESAPEVASDVLQADDLLDVAQGHAELHRALMLLNAQPRQLVALAFFRGLSHEEIAAQTALPLGTVKSQIRRALSTLRQMLGSSGLQGLAS